MLNVKYRKLDNFTNIDIFKQYYLDIQGGIDGYYEKTILDADIYEVVDKSTMAYFSIHCDRGLTSLVALKAYAELYIDIFDFVIKLPLFDKILFTENDSNFLECVQNHNINYEVQAYNFDVKEQIESSIGLIPVDKFSSDLAKLYFNEFIVYNNIDLDSIESFIYKKGNEAISLGAIEPLKLNANRYCISMIVNEKYRQKGYGCETVKFLIQYLQSKNREVNARCYIKNEISKNTLLKSGMYICNKLFKAEDL